MTYTDLMEKLTGQYADENGTISGEDAMVLFQVGALLRQKGGDATAPYGMVQLLTGEDNILYLHARRKEAKAM